MIGLCPDPHLLLWILFDGQLGLPAKLLGIENNNVHVLYFGSHRREVVRVQSVYLFSMRNRDSVITNATQSIAIDVNIHICTFLSI